jgi:hypothetical protein
MAELPAPNDLVLVVLLPQPRDLEIARVLGWYRIPLRFAPKVVAPDYLAFYQPASFGGHKWRIELVAPVKGHELATRRELFKEEPNHPRALDEYFKMQLGTLQELPHPIAAVNWKRITFFYTTGELLLAADSIADLGLPDKERPIIYRALRERGLAQQPDPNLPELPLNLDLVALFGMHGTGAAYFADLD